MRGDVYFIITFDVQPEQRGAVTSLLATVAEQSRQEEGCLAYECAIRTDNSKVHIIEHFTSSQSLLSHITSSFAQHVTSWNKLLSLLTFFVIGEPDQQIRSLLPPEAVYFDRVAGFTK